MSRAVKGRVLITGADGVLGTAWRELLASRGVAFTATDRASLDICDAPAVAAALDAGKGTDRVGVLVNCAAYTDVDGAETEAEAANRLNGDAVGVLADACGARGTLLVHYSTDYVFNGRSTTPYVTGHPRDPVNAYGVSKALGEERLEAGTCEHLTVRTSWLYAAWGSNFVRTILRLAGERDELRVVSDQRGRPTEARHLAETTLALFESGRRGFAHATDGGECSWYEFAAEIVRQAGLGCVVRPCGTDEFPRPAVRPPYSVLDIGATEEVIGPLPHWTINLERTLRSVAD